MLRITAPLQYLATNRTEFISLRLYFLPDNLTMRIRTLSFCLLAFLSILSFTHCQKNEPPAYDLVVYGGTSAGVVAAYTARQMGKKVLLIEPGQRLGGLTSGGLGYTDIGNKYAITGISREFYRELGRRYGKFEQWIFEPGVAKAVFEDYIKKANVEVLYGHRLAGVSKSDARIESIELEETANPANPKKKISAKMFIDTSYEGDLMAKAGVSYKVGREANEDYSETYNGVQLMDGHQFPDGIDPYKVPGDSSSGLLWGISPEALAPDGTGDSKEQAYNYRICLTNNPDNMVPITRPENYDSSRYELLLRLIAAQPDKRTLNDYFIWSRMPNQKTDINNRGGFSTDMIGMNYDYPEGSYEEREKIIKAHEDYTKGLLYFYGHDPRVPEALRNDMLQWGYPKDEYTENGHWSPQLYIREARRMIGEYVMTQANCQGKEVVEDGIGMAAYTMDSHNCQRIVIEKDGRKMVKNEGNVEIGGFGPYPISYRSITPKAAECENLLVPVCLSATHIAFGSIRMEPVFMVLAQSAAVAASFAIDENLGVQQVDVRKLGEELRNNPLADGSAPDILLDNDDASAVSTQGEWTSVAFGGYGPSYLSSTPGGEVTAVFSAEIGRTGRYSVYTYIPKSENGSSGMKLIVDTGSEIKEVTLDLAGLTVEGQTSGEWTHAGTFSLAEGSRFSATVSNEGADGIVAADAVLLVPER